MPAPELAQYQDIVHRIEDCNSLKNKLREWLARGIDGKLARSNNPNRILAKNLEEPVYELQRATAEMQMVIAKYGLPSEQMNTLEVAMFGGLPLVLEWLDQWYWAGIDDLKRLRIRVDYYAAAVQEAKLMPDDMQRVFLEERVVQPIFFGVRQQDVMDPQSPQIFTTPDFCMPLFIYKNYLYATQVDQQVTGLLPFMTTMGEVVVFYADALHIFYERMVRGIKRVVKAIKVGIVPAVILAAVVGLVTLRRKNN